MTDTVTRVDRLALRLLRERTGYSIRQLADAAGVSFSQVAAIERGDNEPRPATVKKLADALEVPVTQITVMERAS